MTIYGSLQVLNLNMSGYLGSTSNGGQCLVYQDVTAVRNIEMRGNEGGDGGFLSVWGNIINLFGTSVDVSGGVSVDSNGGEGGSILVKGNINVSGTSCTINASGGDSTNLNGGNSGNINIYGSLFCNNITFSLNGGEVDAATMTALFSGNGGSLMINDNVTCQSLVVNVRGGNNATDSGRGGDGGNVSIYGTTTGTVSITVDGGNGLQQNEPPYGANAGVGGNIIFNNTVKSNSFSASLCGGISDNNNGGNGGLITFGGLVNCTSFNCVAHGGDNTNGYWCKCWSNNIL